MSPERRQGQLRGLCQRTAPRFALHHHSSGEFRETAVISHSTKRMKEKHGSERCQSTASSHPWQSRFLTSWISNQSLKGVANKGKAQADHLTPEARQKRGNSDPKHQRSPTDNDPDS